MASSLGISHYLDPLIVAARSELQNKTAYARVWLEPFHDELRAVGRHYDWVPFEVLLVMHSLFVASLFRRSEYTRFWPALFWVSFIAAFGSGSLVNVCFHDYPAWLRSDAILLTYAVCWYLILFSPRDIVFKVYSILPVRAACKLATTLLKARNISNSVHRAVQVFGPSQIVAPLFFGVLGGCGGTYLTDVASYILGIKKPIEFLEPSWTTRSAFLSAVFYLFAVHWYAILPQDVATAIGITVLAAQSLGAELTGWPLDFTAPFEYLFHSLSGIPHTLSSRDEGHQPSGKAVFEARKKKVS